MEKQYDAVVAGYTCVDLIPRFDKNVGSGSIISLFSPGKLIEIERMDFVLGGVVPNTGLTMKRFGQKVYLNGLIGNDMLGKIVEEHLKKCHAFEGIVKTDESSTAYSIVLAPPEIDRIFLESPGCNRIFAMEHIDFETISNTKLFHFGYPPLLKQFFSDNGRQLIEMFSKIQQMGVVTSLDFSLPDPESESGKVNWPGILEKTLPFVDIFVPSLEELLQMMMPKEYSKIISLPDYIMKVPVELIRELSKKIISLGVKILLIKMGARGAYLLSNDVSFINKKLGYTLQEKEWNVQEIWCNAYQIHGSKITHASGAGDTAVAAFLSAVLNGENPETALKYSAIAGRESLYCHVVYNDICDWRQLTEKINTEQNEMNYFR